MMIKIAACLLTVGLMTACETTTTTTKREDTARDDHALRKQRQRASSTRTGPAG